MTYANNIIGFNSALYGRREAKAATLVYCDECADHIFPKNPAYDPNDPYGPDRLIRDDFGWQPVFGDYCTRCGCFA